MSPASSSAIVLAGSPSGIYLGCYIQGGHLTTCCRCNRIGWPVNSGRVWVPYVLIDSGWPEGGARGGIFIAKTEPPRPTHKICYHSACSDLIVRMTSRKLSRCVRTYAAVLPIATYDTHIIIPLPLFCRSPGREPAGRDALDRQEHPRVHGVCMYAMPVPCHAPTPSPSLPFL